MIKIVGLGADSLDLTLRAVEAIRGSDCVVVKTAFMPTYNFFLENNIKHITLDDIYNSADNFEELNQKLLEKILSLAKANKNLCYCVGGSPFDDRSVELILSSHKCEVVGGVSFAENALLACANTLKGNIVGYSTTNAYDFIDGWIDFDRSKPLVITEVDNGYIASDIVTKLSSKLGDEEEVLLVNGDKNLKKVKLSEFDYSGKFSYKTSIVTLAKRVEEATRFGFIDVVKIFDILRGDGGCDWDRAQTHQSIRSNLVEEAYELVEAINNEDISNMIEECGDIMLQAIFHSKIGEDCGEFSLDDTLSGLGEKLVRRHTHIFGTTKASNKDEALKAWETAKAIEKKHGTQSERMQGITASLPSLMKAEKIQKIAQKVGFGLSDKTSAYAKVFEEIEEFKKAEGEDVEIKGGDLLFAAVNVIRMAGISCEIALSKSIKKFETRFTFVEGELAKLGKKIEEADKTILEVLWQSSKEFL